MARDAEGSAHAGAPRPWGEAAAPSYTPARPSSFLTASTSASVSGLLT